ncbi:uncharacterized protein LOC143589939 [Bidens hawaiensis]|uniref:uncharacterized protein LOC143589939 n=1 Tax=Bidens hawaiensis TaxID=980011 RepID=UPI00404AD07E
MIQPFLLTNGLFPYIDGTIVCPYNTVTVSSSSSDKEPALLTQQPNLEYLSWISNDAHVRMLLLSTIYEAYFKHVQGDTSRELWLSLERAYAPHTSTREYTLKTQLLKIQMKPEETFIAYLTRAQEYSDALANIGEPMKEKDIVMLVISGLREEYNYLKPTLITRHPPVVFLELHGLHADHEYMTKKTDPEPTVLAVQAFTATSSRGSSTVSLPSETV